MKSKVKGYSIFYNIYFFIHGYDYNVEHTDTDNACCPRFVVTYSVTSDETKCAIRQWL